MTNDFRLNATGITDFVRALAVAQAESGDAVAVLCRTSDDAMQKMMRDRGVHVVATSQMGLVRGAGLSARAFRRADVVHAHTVRGLLTSAFLGPRSFWYRSIATVHNPYGRFSGCLGLARVTASLSSTARPRPLSRGRQVFISNPIIDPLVTLESDRPPLPAMSVLYVGGLSHRKGTDVLLAAWREVVAAVPGSTLHLVGNRDAPQFEAMAEDLGVTDSVRFHGVLADPRPEMRSATVFVLPSRREGFPLVILQARRAGAAIVATAVDGTGDALDGGEAGLLVPAGDVGALAAAVISLLREPEERARLASRAVYRLERFSVEAIRRRYDIAYAWLDRRRSSAVDDRPGSGSPATSRRRPVTVSVVMGTYNGAAWLESQLDSLLAQRTPPHEIVVGDDASTDDTAAIIERAAARTAIPIRLHRNEERLNWRENFQRSAERATGDYIAFCDQDDVWRADKLERVVAAIDEETTLVYHGAALIDGQGARTGRLDRGPVEDTVWEPLEAPWWRTPLGFSMVFRADLLRHISLWEDSRDQTNLDEQAAHDQWYWFLASVFGRTKYLADELVDYRLHASNAMGHSDRGPRLRQLVDIAAATADKCERKVRILENRIDLLQRMAFADADDLTRRDRAVDVLRDVRAFDERRRRMLTTRAGLTQLARLARLLPSAGYTRSLMPEGRQELIRDLCAVAVGWIR